MKRVSVLFWPIWYLLAVSILVSQNLKATPCLKLFNSKNSPQRIIHVMTADTWGGAENMLFKMIKGMKAQGSRHHVIFVSDIRGPLSKELESIGVQVTYLDTYISKSQPKLPNEIQEQITPLLLDFKPTLFQGWLTMGNLAALQIRDGYWAQISSHNMTTNERSKTPVAWNIRSTLENVERLNESKRWRLNQLKEQSPDVDYAIFNSPRAQRQYADFGLNPNESVFIPNGFDTNRAALLSPPKKNLTRHKLGIHKDQIVFSHVANFVPIKNHDKLIRAAVLAAQSDPRLTFVFIGKDVNHQNKELTRLIPRNLRYRILLLGERRDVFEILASSDAYINGSSVEGFSNAVAEGMLAGLPGVVSDVGFSKRLIDNAGLILRHNANVTTWARSFLALAKADPLERKKLGAKARKIIIEQYALEHIASLYLKLYQNQL
jgi:glycosyltransferase involved in cell wall biosynthesis